VLGYQSPNPHMPKFVSTKNNTAPATDAPASRQTVGLRRTQKPRHVMSAKLPYTTGVMEENPSTRSLRNIAASGTRNAARLRANVAPPNSASDAMGEKSGGCGINRAAVPAKTIVARIVKRFIFISVSS